MFALYADNYLYKLYDTEEEAEAAGRALFRHFGYVTRCLFVPEGRTAKNCLEY